MLSTPPRLCHAGFAPEQEKAGAAAARAAELGFSHIVFGASGLVNSGEPEDIRELVAACAAAELETLLDLEISELPLDHPLVHQHPECFTLTAQGCGEYVDPRVPNSTQGCAIARPQQNPEPFIAWWADVLSRLSGAGVRGFRVLDPQICGGQVWQELIARMRQRNSAHLFIADTPRLTQHDVSDLRQAGFDFCLSSLPWWNGRAPWLVEQHAPASRVAPVIALIEAPEHEPPAATELRRTRLAVAAVTGAGVMMPLGYETASLDGEPYDLSACVRAMNAIVKSEIVANGALRSLTGPGVPITVLLRADAPDERIADRGFALLINPLGERRAKASPLRDVAGMLRSFDYAAYIAEREQSAVDASTAKERIEALLVEFRRVAVNAFLHGYERGRGAALNSAERRLLNAFALEKAAYEIVYEATNRPGWIDVPLRGFATIADELLGAAA